MIDPFTGAAIVSGVASFAGGLINRSSTRSTNASNLEAVRETNDANRTENRLAREFAVAQVARQQTFDTNASNLAWERETVAAKQAFNRTQEAYKEARSWDRSQVIDAREYDSKEAIDAFARTNAAAMAAEKRGREYLQEDRAYSDPSAVRARLEAAGMNPLTGIDASTGVGGGGAIYGGASGAASSGIASSGVATHSLARATAPTSGIAQAATIPMIAASSMASNWGDSIAAAGMAYANGIDAQQEMALRRTQTQLEAERLQRVVQNATMSPVVQGPYAGPRTTSTSRVVRPLADEFTRPAFTGDREVMVMPASNGAGITTIENELTGPMHIPGNDGEPWGIDELATAAVVGLPQWLYNSVRNDYNYWKPRVSEMFSPASRVNRSQTTINQRSGSTRRANR